MTPEGCRKGPDDQNAGAEDIRGTDAISNPYSTIGATKGNERRLFGQPVNERTNEL